MTIIHAEILAKNASPYDISYVQRKKQKNNNILRKRLQISNLHTAFNMTNHI